MPALLVSLPISSETLTSTASTTMSSLLSKRQYYGYGYNNYYGNSRWGNWGRWVLLAVIIAVALIAFFLVSCLNARRRRKQGVTPMYGTSWMAPQHGAVNYYGPNGANTQQPLNDNNPNDYAPPSYNPAPNGNAGFYGQQNGIELQQPGQTYQPPGGAVGETYAPPEGPPPKKRGLFR